MAFTISWACAFCGNKHCLDSWTIQYFFLFHCQMNQNANLLQAPLICPLLPCAALTLALPSPRWRLWVCPLGRWGLPFHCPAGHWTPWLSCTSPPLLTENPDQKEEQSFTQKYWSSFTCYETTTEHNNKQIKHTRTPHWRLDKKKV